MEINKVLYIGRFQPFHNGHYKALKWILEKNSEVILAIGSSQYSYTKENPFTAGERIEMIHEQLKSDKLIDKVIIIPIPDIGKHKLWVSVVEQYCPKFNIVYSNEPLTRLLFLESGYRVESIPFFEREKYEASKIREKIANNEEWEKFLPNKVLEFIKKRNLDKRIKYIYKKV